MGWRQRRAMSVGLARPGPNLFVIASVAKQSRAYCADALDWLAFGQLRFRRYAPRNDEGWVWRPEVGLAFRRAGLCRACESERRQAEEARDRAVHSPSTDAPRARARGEVFRVWGARCAVPPCGGGPRYHQIYYQHGGIRWHEAAPYRIHYTTKNPQKSATCGIFWNPPGEDFGDPYGTRTRVSAVRGPRPNR